MSGDAGGRFRCIIFIVDVGVFSKVYQEVALSTLLVTITLSSGEIKFKTFFTNCIQESLANREYRQTEDDDWNVYWCEK